MNHKAGKCLCGKWHFQGKDFDTENAMLKFQVGFLKSEIKKWNNAWHEMRIRVGKCFWEIPYKG